MFKVVKLVEPVAPVCEISHVERLVKEGKVLICLYDNRASIFIHNDKCFFYHFSKSEGWCNIHSQSRSVQELLEKQNLNNVELYIFESLREFFLHAEKQGWNY
jgi:hypothetical protein